MRHEPERGKTQEGPKSRRDDGGLCVVETQPEGEVVGEENSS